MARAINLKNLLYHRELFKLCMYNTIFLVLRELSSEVDIVEPRLSCRRRSKRINQCLIYDLLASRAGNANTKRHIERPAARWDSPATVALLWPTAGVVRVVNERRPVGVAGTLDLNLGHAPRTVGVHSRQFEVIRPTAVTQPNVHITRLGALHSAVPDRDHALSQASVPLQTAHGDVGEIHVVTAGREGTAVREINLSTVVGTGAA